MANSNTKQARKHGYPSLKDMQTNGNKVFKGECCDTGWDNKNSKHNQRKNYSKRPLQDMGD
jgi:hypothetical protein